MSLLRLSGWAPVQGWSALSERVVVVGAGLSGLIAAASRAARGDSVILVERLPTVGGVWGFDHPAVIAAAQECRRLGVEFLLGSSAIRWRDRRLLVVGPGAVRWIEADRLVFAGGNRPPTAAELGIAGGRLAGVFASTVAHHLLDAGVVLGHRPVVVGGTDEAAIVLPHLMEHGRVTVVGGTPPAGALGERVDWWPGYSPLRLHGTDRVDLLDIGHGSATVQLYCDAVILAGPLLPLRNVDGAVRDQSDGVVFVQPLDPGLDARALRRVVQEAAAPTRPEGVLVP